MKKLELKSWDVFQPQSLEITLLFTYNPLPGARAVSSKSTSLSLYRKMP